MRRWSGKRWPPDRDPAVVSELAETLTLLLAPFAPHLAEEVWQQLGRAGSVYRAPWPVFDPGGGRRRERSTSWSRSTARSRTR